MIHPLISLAEQGSVKEKPPEVEIGDTVDVHYRIVEGKKERVQIFSGDVIMMRGRGATKTFTVRRLVASEGVERIFPFNSPAVEKVVVKRKGRVRRAKLYYLRDRVGKATRITERKRPVSTKAKPATGSAHAKGPKQAKDEVPAQVGA